MKNPHTPYYTLPVCYFERLPDSDSDMDMQQQQQIQQLQQHMQQMQPQQMQDQQIQQQQPMTSADMLAPITSTTQPQALTLTSTEYLNGFLRTQIGKNVRVEFLIGTGTLVDKFGRLLSVGANYITIRQAETDDIVVCDFFTIKFITFYL